MRLRSRAIAMTIALTLVGTQPAVLCGLSCLAKGTPAESLAHGHHRAPKAPCATGGVTAADGIPNQNQPVGLALRSAIAFDLLGADVPAPDGTRPTAFIPILHCDNPDPPPRV